jgi:type II secretory pathway pseudopilin PulG
MAVRWPRHGRDDPGDRGETLVELLVTITVMGVTVVAILGSIAVTIMLSATHRKQAAVGTYVRSFAEAVETKVATTTYKPCAQPADYASVAPSLPSGYTSSVTAVTYWNGSSFVGSLASCPGTDQGVQRVTVRVATSDNKVVETLDVIVREPCRPADNPCS